MKFGKRLLAEAERDNLQNYLDYKALKRAIKLDVEAQDATGSAFSAALIQELAKVAAFYFNEEQALASTVTAALAAAPNATYQTNIALLRSKVHNLRKYVVLNYIAVVKAVKKRNRHLKAACGEATPSLKAVNILAGEHFFTSLRLAGLMTQVEIAGREGAFDGAINTASSTEMVADFTCPICLNLLHSPVILSCAHRFCWGCLISYCSTVQGTAIPSSATATSFKQPKDSHLRTISTPTTPSSVSRPAVWESEASDDETATVATFGCPCCRQDQLLDLDRLQVDPHLESFLTKLEIDTKRSYPFTQPASQLLDATPPPVSCNFLLPPMKPVSQECLTVCLDLDGTLVTTFTPKRAPSLGPTAVSYIVGQGGKLNPGGVFVVERPGLGDFLKRISVFSEVVLFTAGLEDYAAPICDEIERRYGKFDYRLYRQATTESNVYPCVKDISRLGRPLTRCVLVDDTPLAFFHQPDHGIPVLPYKGDIDDRLLNEAVAPLLEALHQEKDVTGYLHKRFGMRQWFKSQGLEPPKTSLAAQKNDQITLMIRTPSASVSAETFSTRFKLPKPIRAPRPVPSQSSLNSDGNRHLPLIITDFDKTLTDYDAAERLCDGLAPELTSLLSQISTPANFIPVTQTVLSEMHRRGVDRDHIVRELTKMGGEVPEGSKILLQWLAGKGIDVTILSDANTVFIGHVLGSAQLSGCVTEVISNKGSFQKVFMPAGRPGAHLPSPPSLASTLEQISGDSSSDEEMEVANAAMAREEPNIASSSSTWKSIFGSKRSSKPVAREATPTYRLTVQPHFDHSQFSHGCHLCPANLCKGRELYSIKQQQQQGRIFYLGDGANDYCPVINCLGPKDVVFARAEYPLDGMLRENKSKIQAEVKVWNSHHELCRLVMKEVEIELKHLSEDCRNNRKD